jgi:modulator of FtsH protease
VRPSAALLASVALASEVFRPDEWRDFFLEVGGAAAVLTGLVFVAMSINLDDVTHDATHRNRAIGTLAGMIAAFVICSVALMAGQGHVAIGVEWATVAAIAGGVYVSGYIRAFRSGGSNVGLRLPRLATGTTLYIAEIAGACALIAGRVAGLYVAAVSMLLLLVWMISGAWLLIAGVASGSADRRGTP